MLFALGVIGWWVARRPPRRPLSVVARDLARTPVALRSRPVPPGHDPGDPRGRSGGPPGTAWGGRGEVSVHIDHVVRSAVTPLGRASATWLESGPVSRLPVWQRVVADLSVSGRDVVGVATGSVIGGGLGLLLPLLVWLGLALSGHVLPLLLALVAAVLAGAAGLLHPWTELIRDARRRRAHVVVVLSSFVDLVALGLAGGVGVEGALLAAANVTDDWVARRIGRALSSARDRGASAWDALGQVGHELGVDQLIELSATLQLAGTEGSRIRQALTARSVALRRHLLADEESAANATTERLFLPGTLLLLGFLLFIGYPAVSHVLGGF
jgi:tight adherence protein C